MHVVHFTYPATDPLEYFGAAGARFLPIADGQGDTHVSCLHLDMGGRIEAPPTSHATLILIVHGRVTIQIMDIGVGINFFAGMGAVLSQNEPYTLKADTAAILLLVESEQLTAHIRAISTPQRIEGATWPSDSYFAAWGPIYDKLVF